MQQILIWFDFNLSRFIICNHLLYGILHTHNCQFNKHVYVLVVGVGEAVIKQKFFDPLLIQFSSTQLKY